MSTITAQHVRELHDRPDTSLVLTATEDGYVASVVTPAEMVPGQVAVYNTDWSEPNGQGLSHQVRTYITHDWCRSAHAAEVRAGGDPEDVFDLIADRMSRVALFTWSERGTDALADELVDDPAAWTRYVA